MTIESEWVILKMQRNSLNPCYNGMTIEYYVAHDIDNKQGS